MSNFEAVLLLSPDISKTVRDNVCNSFTKNISEHSGKIINAEDWDLRDLSYKIDIYSKAYYNFFQIEIDGKNIEFLKKYISQDENIIRNIFVKVDKHQELPTKLNNEKK